MTWCAAVASVEPTSSGQQVTLVPSDSGEGRSVVVRLPEKMPLPFAAGDVISAHIRTERMAIRWIVNATIADQQGHLLIGYSENGLAETAPGWGVLRGPSEAPGSPPTTQAAQMLVQGVLLSHGGAVARIPAGQWRQLRDPNGVWATTGSVQSWTKGVRPPDAVDSMTFGVVRLCERPGCR